MTVRGGPVSTVLWGSFLASQVIYVVLGLSGMLRAADPLDPASSVRTILPVAFAGLAVVLAVASQFVFARTADRPPGPIVTWALDEAIAILGLVLCLVGSPRSFWLPFSAIGFGLTILHRPRPSAG